MLAMSLLAYVFSAFLAHPKLAEVVHDTLMPSLHLGRDALSILVAIIGTSLSAYLQRRLKKKQAAGKHTLRQRGGTIDSELRTNL
jgi:Mn2+/Fe2+ NRAMP family transporter